jgi:phosphoglycerate dehydrogenase-like enzyme
VLAWSQNLTDERAAEAGARRVDKATLLAESDVVSVHLVLSDRSRGTIRAEDIARMKPGAILVNTSRAPLIEEPALIAAAREGRIVAALDVYEREPLPADHPLVSCPNTVLTPHLGYSAMEVYRVFYQQHVENALAWLDGNPIRVLPPQ